LKRSLPILLGSGLRARGLFLPDQMDPDEYIREFGTEALQELIKKAEDLLILVLKSWLQGTRGKFPRKLKFQSN